MVFHSWAPPPSLPAPFCQVLSSMNIPLTIPLPTPGFALLVSHRAGSSLRVTQVGVAVAFTQLAVAKVQSAPSARVALGAVLGDRGKFGLHAHRVPARASKSSLLSFLHLPVSRLHWL